MHEDAHEVDSEGGYDVWAVTDDGQSAELIETCHDSMHANRVMHRTDGYAAIGRAGVMLRAKGSTPAKAVGILRRAIEHAALTARAETPARGEVEAPAPVVTSVSEGTEPTAPSTSKRTRKRSSVASRTPEPTPPTPVPAPIIEAPAPVVEEPVALDSQPEPEAPVEQLVDEAMDDRAPEADPVVLETPTPIEQAPAFVEAVASIDAPEIPSKRRTRRAARTRTARPLVARSSTEAKAQPRTVPQRIDALIQDTARRLVDIFVAEVVRALAPRAPR